MQYAWIILSVLYLDYHPILRFCLVNGKEYVPLVFSELWDDSLFHVMTKKFYFL